MYNLARGLEKLARGLGVEIRLGAEVKSIEPRGESVGGIVLDDGSRFDADIVISNMEVIPAYRELLNEGPEFLKTLEKFEPACSGLVLHLGTDRPYPGLAHHNFIYSADQKEHFHTVFRKKKIPRDPTLYVVAPSRSDPSVCPEGCDNIKILPHIPHLDATNPPGRADYEALRERVLEKMERMGFEDLRKHIVVEDLWTPRDIQKRYYSNRGAIYGVVSDRWKNFALKAPKRSSRYANLFFVGGSVNPGGGMPMVVLGGRNVARSVQEAFPPRGSK
jgi:diapolycopene oxygenase